MYSQIVLPSFAVFLTLTSVWGCSFPPGKGPPVYTMTQTLQEASVVVSGTDVYHTPMDRHPRNYTFQVSCVFKSNGLIIPRTIFLLEVGATSCDGTHLDPVGKSYIIGLKVAPNNHWGDQVILNTDPSSPEYFLADEPAASNTAAFLVNAANLNTTAMLFGINNTFTYLGEGQAGDHQCPMNNVTHETTTNDASTDDGTSSVAPIHQFRTIHVALLFIPFCFLSRM